MTTPCGWQSGRLAEGGPATGKAVEPGVKAGARLARGFKDGHAGTDRVDVGEGQVAVEFTGGGEVALGDRRDVSRVEQPRVFQGLVFSFRH